MISYNLSSQLQSCFSGNSMVIPSAHHVRSAPQPKYCKRSFPCAYHFIFDAHLTTAPNEPIYILEDEITRSTSPDCSVPACNRKTQPRNYPFYQRNKKSSKKIKNLRSFFPETSLYSVREKKTLMIRSPEPYNCPDQKKNAPLKKKYA